MGQHDSIEVLIIGGGIAGASVAFALTHGPDRSEFPGPVRLIEAEPTLAYHTTGRSAAQLIENYGAQPNRAVTSASLEFLHNPPEGLTDTALLTTRGILTAGGPGSYDRIGEELRAGQAINPTITEISPAEAVEIVPALRIDMIERAMWEPESADIDVAGLHQAFVRGFRRTGGDIRPSTRFIQAQPDGAGWRAETTAGPILCGHIINAAGAWGDLVAQRCGVAPLGLQPMRRTAFMVKSGFPDSGHWPLFGDVEDGWYIKPDGAQFMCSPADETPSEPLDAKADELDVAMAIDRINAATWLNIRAVASTWAGLRTFSPDRAMVLGPDPVHRGFHWCVGQGGIGIQSAVGAGQIVADLLRDGRLGPSLLDLPHGITIDLAGLLPDRFRAGG